jgi:hypothetical protein
MNPKFHTADNKQAAFQNKHLLVLYTVHKIKFNTV